MPLKYGAILSNSLCRKGYWKVKLHATKESPVRIIFLNIAEKSPISQGRQKRPSKRKSFMNLRRPCLIDRGTLFQTYNSPKVRWKGIKS